MNAATIGKSRFKDFIQSLIESNNLRFEPIKENNTAWKVSVFAVILVRIFPHSDWIRRDLRIQFECGKIRNRITPNTDTFYAEQIAQFRQSYYNKDHEGSWKRTIEIKNDRETFARLLVIKRIRDIDIKEVLRHELSSVPLALSNPHITSTLCKTAKNELFKLLKFSLGTETVIPMNALKI